MTDSATPWTAQLQASCPSSTPGACPNSCPSSSWRHPTISSSAVPFSSRLQSFPASGSFQMSQFFTSGGQSIRVSALASVLPMNIQDWFPLGWTGWISLLSKGLWRVFSKTAIQKHQFFGAQLSLWSYTHIYMTTGKSIALTRGTYVGKVTSMLFNMLSGLVIAFLPKSKRIFNSMAAFTVHSDFGAQENKVCHCLHCFSIYWSPSHEVMELGFMIFIYWVLR